MKLAQLVIPGINPEGTPTDVVIDGPDGLKFGNLGELITSLIPLLLTLSSIMLFLYLIWGGFDYLLSGGEPQKMEAGKSKVTNAIIGFIIVFVSYFIVQLVGRLFNIPLF